MWELLSDPGHAVSFEQLGEAYAPLRRLVEQLARREYAGRVYAYKATSLGFGLWFSAGAVAFLGYGWLTEHIVPRNGRSGKCYARNSTCRAPQTDVGKSCDLCRRRKNS